MLSKANALEKLRRQQGAIDQVPPNSSSPEFTKWQRDTEVAVANVFGEDTRHVKEFARLNYSSVVWGDDDAEREACSQGLNLAKALLQSMIDEIQEYRPDQEVSGEKGETSPESPRSLLVSLRVIKDVTFDDGIAVDAWQRRAKMIVEKVFGRQSAYIDELRQVSHFPIYLHGIKPQARREFWNDGRAKASSFVETLIEDFALGTTEKSIVGTPITNDVFVVHGHDEAMKQSVCRTLEKLGLNPIVLHEKPNRGRTIIEKFTDYTAVGFAVVLLSSDDVGCERGKQPNALRPRARQNVILELGFFLGRLGRDRVMALCQQVGDFDLPSDYSGVVFTRFDEAGHWRFDLVKELNAAGYSMDANKLLP